MEKYDIVIFGASGFTGQFVVEELARYTASANANLKWAIAGRNESKLKKVLQQATDAVQRDLTQTPVVIADVNDEKSILSMCIATEVVLNCVGPYRFFGEAVVKACVDTGTHYLDISGEPQFLESMQLKYHDKAKDAGCYVIGACGFDSIPFDLGVTFTTDNFKGDLNSIESFLQIKSGPKGSIIHFATYQSAIYGFAFAGELSKLRKKLFPTPLPKPAHKAPKRPKLFREGQVGNDWCIPFMGSDRSIGMRTQRYNYEHYKARSVQLSPFLRISSTFGLAMMMIVFPIFAFLAHFKLGRALLERFPRLFTFGYVSHEGPTREQIEGASFNMQFFAQGYSTKIDDPDQQHTEKPEAKIHTEVKGPEVGYAATPICMVAAAVTLIEETNNLPPGGGVFTPGAVFARTGLIDRLNKRGVTFNVIE